MLRLLNQLTVRCLLVLALLVSHLKVSMSSDLAARTKLSLAIFLCTQKLGLFDWQLIKVIEPP
jgi:hypothetical protein